MKITAPSLVAAFVVCTTMLTIATSVADDYGNYGAHGRYGPDYGYRKTHEYGRRPELMTRFELTRQIERQGYTAVRDVRPNANGGDWHATAHVDGTPVRLTIDPYSGKVLGAQSI